jgi:hypothetical protein
MIEPLNATTPAQALAWLKDRTSLGSPEAKMLEDMVRVFALQARQYEFSARLLMAVLVRHQKDTLVPKPEVLAILHPIRDIVAAFPAMGVPGIAQEPLDGTPQQEH